MWQFISSIILIFLVFFLIYEDYTVTKKPYPRGLNGVVYNNTQYVCSEGILYNLFSCAASGLRARLLGVGRDRAPTAVRRRVRRLVPAIPVALPLPGQRQPLQHLRDAATDLQGPLPNALRVCAGPWRPALFHLPRGVRPLAADRLRP